MRDCGHEHGSALRTFELVIAKISNLGPRILRKCSHVPDESWCPWCLSFAMVMDTLPWEMRSPTLVVLAGPASLRASSFDDTVVSHEFFRFLYSKGAQ